MTFLIDGYNLLHAVGWANRRLGPGKLEAARRRLLDWLADTVAVKSGAAHVRVVFDAQKGLASSAGQSHRGVLVQFAFRRTADDEIEELLEAEQTPAELVVVSNDTRLQESARRNGAKGWSSQEFLDWLLECERPGLTRPGQAQPLADEKPDGPLPPTEVEELLRAFAKPKPRK